MANLYCRLCLTAKATIELSNSCILRDMLEDLISIKIDPHGKFYTKICAACDHKIKDFKFFKDTIMLNQEIVLKNISLSERVLNSIIYDPVIIKDETDDKVANAAIKIDTVSNIYDDDVICTGQIRNISEYYKVIDCPVCPRSFLSEELVKKHLSKHFPNNKDIVSPTLEPNTASKLIDTTAAVTTNNSANQQKSASESKNLVLPRKSSRLRTKSLHASRSCSCLDVSAAEEIPAPKSSVAGKRRNRELTFCYAREPEIAKKMKTSDADVPVSSSNRTPCSKDGDQLAEVSTSQQASFLEQQQPPTTSRLSHQQIGIAQTDSPLPVNVVQLPTNATKQATPVRAFKLKLNKLKNKPISLGFICTSTKCEVGVADLTTPEKMVSRQSIMKPTFFKQLVKVLSKNDCGVIRSQLENLFMDNMPDKLAEIMRSVPV